MFVKVHKPGKFTGGDNKGSSSSLFEYLDKENRDNYGLDLDDDRIEFFSHTTDNVSKLTAITSIDKNNKHISKSDNKFYMLSINPSQYELRHLVKKSIGREVSDYSKLTIKEQEIIQENLRDYTRKVMDNYAKNFNRNDIIDGNNLVYFAKIETQRTYKHYDSAVIHNKEVLKNIIKVRNEEIQLKKEGKNTDDIPDRIKSLEALYQRSNGNIITKNTVKQGLQLHVHVVVSRNDSEQKTKLSPLSKSKGGTQKLNGKDVMQGFNHEVFKEKSIEIFNEKYGYKSKYKENYNSRESSKNIDKSPPDRTLSNFEGKVKGKAISQVKQTLTQGHFKEELNAISKAKEIVQLISNPKAKVIKLALKKIKDILLGGITRG